MKRRYILYYSKIKNQRHTYIWSPTITALYAVNHLGGCHCLALSFAIKNDLWFIIGCVAVVVIYFTLASFLLSLPFFTPTSTVYYDLFGSKRVFISI